VVSRFLLRAIGINRMRHENAGAHQTKKTCCNIQHRIGPTFRRKIRLSRIEVIWNACWKEDTPPAIPAGCLAKSFVIFGVASLPISR
jgi:hypothetical protein